MFEPEGIRVSKFIELAHEHSRPDSSIEFYVKYGEAEYYATLDRVGAFGVIPNLEVTVKLPPDILVDHDLAKRKELEEVLMDEPNKYGGPEYTSRKECRNELRAELRQALARIYPIE